MGTDIQCESAALTTTGGRVWSASHDMFTFLKEKTDIFSLKKGRILELGSGCGWLGMEVASLLPSTVEVVLTEQEEGGGLQWLQHNVELNQQRGVPLDNVTCRTCDWNEVPDDLRNVDWDFIIGTELVYLPILTKIFPRAISQLIHPPNTQVYYGHMLGRYESMDLDLIDNFRALNLEPREQLQPGMTELPPEDEHFTQLFPEMRLAVYKIAPVTSGIPAS
ncbi:hypothetical protein FOL47_007004 [Perkinsus chesapeaki]|uniref:Uncharacterized protein n=1 Tax=Perkinsus chesapeaki TaxID=330153 RepID=A0A7J6MX51_PERCH|nr:hypothetical protein FOL47_007004 [Perkinsus chesapeaki]|mmetsp:Transcript_8269/g.7009  ORF Transcript_8269/g.7009 Transcript_8269/m.7009 type:complete len:221 (+) Transcript_8269:42-704(+)